MYNPNSAIERVKNHLAYKLGQAMIDFTNNGGGYIALFKKLYKIKKQHKKEQKIYQQTIQIFPQLKYPSLETCGDYEQALRYKFHLSYMLGEVLIKADKTWHKGSGFKLKNDIKKANKEFQIFREIFKEFDQINSSILEGLINNKQLFLKEFPRIKNILKIHQDYKAILDNIFHNFNYFIQNFDLIEEWLLSDDFNERYKKGSHPYPSLLDPKKLNDENEKINYKNIPAELAWEMNLPLPDGYKFVLIGGHGTGELAFQEMLSRCNVKILEKNIWYDNGLDRYKAFYGNLKIKNNYITCIPIIECNFYQYDKYLHMINKHVPAICLVRDPIKIMTSVYNHKILKNKDNLNFSNLNCTDHLFDNYYYAVTKNKTIASKKEIENGINNIKNINKHIRFTYIARTHLKNLKNISHVYYIDVSEISNNKAYETLYRLSKIIGFNMPNDDKLINNLSYTHYLRFIFDIKKPIIYKHYFNNKFIEIYLYGSYNMIN
ncbi:DUF2972 domain-containing protein, partial [Campylobacter jejuni]|nr:DUF2972 domain-containing protein [Campylobacter jejuni]